MTFLIHEFRSWAGKSRWLVTPALVTGLALRLFGLGDRNTWYDEVSSILFAEKTLGDIVKATAADTMPPLYYFLLHYWLLLGNNLWVARSLSVLLSLGVIVAAFAISRRLFGARVALIAAFLVALNPFQVYHGQDVRMYSLLALSQLLAIYFLLRCLDGSSPGNWTGFALSQVVAMYTHNAAFLSLVTLDLLALGTWRFRHRGIPISFARGLVIANLSVAVLFLPWLVYLPGQLAKVTRAFWTETPGVAEIVRSIVVFTFNLPSPTPWSFPILLSVSLFLFVLMFYSAGKVFWLEATSDRPKGCGFALAFALACFLIPIVLAVLVSFVRPIYVERVLITPSVFYLILLAWTMARLRPRFVAPALVVPVILISAWSLVVYYEYDGFPRAAFPRIVKFMEDSVQDGDVIVHDNKLTFFPAYYLGRVLPQRFLADPVWSINDTLAGQTQEALGLKASALEEAVDGKSRVWFVVFQKSLAEAREQGRANENVEWLNSRFQLANEQSFGDLLVYLYTKKPVP